MANSETSFRAELLKDLRSQNCRALGNSPENDIGRPDIYVKAVGYYPTWIELKYIDSGRAFSITDKQLHWIKQEILHLGVAVWLCCRRVGPLEWAIHMGIERAPCTPDNFVQTRKRGEVWQASLILDTAAVLIKEYLNAQAS